MLKAQSDAVALGQGLGEPLLGGKKASGSTPAGVSCLERESSAAAREAEASLSMKGADRRFVGSTQYGQGSDADRPSLQGRAEEERSPEIFGINENKERKNETVHVTH